MGAEITAFNCFVCGKLYPWPSYIPLRWGAKTYDDFMAQYGLVCQTCVKAKANTILLPDGTLPPSPLSKKSLL